MNYNNLSLDSALSREFSKMGVTVKLKGLLKEITHCGRSLIFMFNFLLFLFLLVCL